MLLDSSHKKWAVGTLAAAVVSLAGYAWLDWLTPRGVTGNSVAGMIYGILGLTLMAFAGLLSLLRRVPAWWWLGSRQHWLRGHVWLGLLSGVVIACHSGFRWGGTLEVILWVLLVLVLGSGVVGLLLQQLLPRLLTTRIPCETPYEQIPHVCRVLRREADALDDAITQAGATEMPQADFKTFYEKEVRPFLEALPPPSRLASPWAAEQAFARFLAWPGLADKHDALNRLKTICDERRLLAEQERLHGWLHGWLLVHVPLSVALLDLGAVHAVAALYY